MSCCPLRRGRRSPAPSPTPTGRCRWGARRSTISLRVRSMRCTKAAPCRFFPKGSRIRSRRSRRCARASRGWRPRSWSARRALRPRPQAMTFDYRGFRGVHAAVPWGRLSGPAAGVIAGTAAVERVAVSRVHVPRMAAIAAAVELHFEWSVSRRIRRNGEPDQAAVDRLCDSAGNGRQWPDSRAAHPA